MMKGKVMGYGWIHETGLSLVFVISGRSADSDAVFSPMPHRHGIEIKTIRPRQHTVHNVHVRKEGRRFERLDRRSMLIHEPLREIQLRHESILKLDGDLMISCDTSTNDIAGMEGFWHNRVRLNTRREQGFTPPRALLHKESVVFSQTPPFSIILPHIILPTQPEEGLW